MYIFVFYFTKTIHFINMKHLVIVCLSASLLICSCTGKEKHTSAWSDTINVETLVVGDGSTPTERNYVGDIGSQREVSLSFLLGGTLTKVAVKNGDHVNQGQLLATVDATTATSMHAAAVATLRQAEDGYRRLEGVYREGGVSEVKWVEMQTNLEKARQAEVSARKHLEDCSIRAPFSGVVSCSDRQVGQEMRPGETFARVIDLNRLLVKFSVPEQEISQIRVGDEATAEVSALGDTPLTLRITDKSLLANPLGHTYCVEASIVPGDVKGLLPDMVAKVHVQLSAEGGIVVPSDCLQTMPEGTVVWVVKGGKADHRLVAVGDFVRNGVVVKEGLAVGDTIVIAGQQKLYTGARVKMR